MELLAYAQSLQRHFNRGEPLVKVIEEMLPIALPCQHDDSLAMRQPAFHLLYYVLRPGLAFMSRHGVQRLFVRRRPRVRIQKPMLGGQDKPRHPRQFDIRSRLSEPVGDVQVLCRARCRQLRRDAGNEINRSAACASMAVSFHLRVQTGVRPPIAPPYCPPPPIASKNIDRIYFLVCSGSSLHGTRSRSQS